MQLSMSKLIVCPLPKKNFGIPPQCGCFDKFLYAKNGLSPVFESYYIIGR